MSFADFTPLGPPCPASPGPVKDAFEALYRRWEAEVADRSSAECVLPSWPFTRRAYAEILAMGEPAVPCIMEKLAQGNFFLTWAL